MMEFFSAAAIKRLEGLITDYCKADALAWAFTNDGDINAALWLNNLQLSLPITKIYRRVNFPKT